MRTSSATVFQPLLLAFAFALGASASAQGNIAMPPLKAGGGYTGPLPQFDVISVKPHKASDDDLMYVHWAQTEYRAENLTVKSMIVNAYNVKVWQVLGLPAWTESQHWDIAAKVSSPDMEVLAKLTPDQRRAMIRGILKDRFGLVAHQESRTQPVFLMTVVDRSKLTPSAPLTDADRDPTKMAAGTWHPGYGTLSATRITMPTLAENLSGQVSRTILDRTGDTGEYTIDLKWTPDDRSDSATADMPPPIVEALKNQLGLKLTASKAEVPVIVVEQVHTPDAN